MLNKLVLSLYQLTKPLDEPIVHLIVRDVSPGSGEIKLWVNGGTLVGRVFI